MMASLRARLLVAVLALTACGLLLAGVTYAEQRSFLYDRVERRSAIAPRRSRLGYGRRRPDGQPPGPTATRPGGDGPGPGPNFGCRPGPTARSATRRAAGSSRQRPRLRAAANRQAGAPGQAHAGPHHHRQRSEGRGHALPRARLSGPEGREHYGRGGPAARGRPDPAPAAPRRGPGDRGRARRARPRRVARRAARPAAARSHGPHRGRDRRRRPLAPRRGRPTRAPRSGAWASRSTRCSTGSSRRSASARPARTACAASSPTPRTSCARRWPRSAATPSSSAWARRASPADIEKAMRRIEDEAARMGVLVEDLLTLARLDEVADAPHGEVDLAALVRDAVDDGRAAAPDREIHLRVDGPAVVVGDRDQLRQVLGNLLRNALVHTPDGHADRGDAGARGRRRAPRGARPRPGPAAQRCRGALRALLALGGRARARQGRRGPRAGDRRGDRRRPRRRRARRQRPGGGASFVVTLPAAA